MCVCVCVCAVLCGFVWFFLFTFPCSFCFSVSLFLWCTLVLAHVLFVFCFLTLPEAPLRPAPPVPGQILERMSPGLRGKFALFIHGWVAVGTGGGGRRPVVAVWWRRGRAGSGGVQGWGGCSVVCVRFDK